MSKTRVLLLTSRPESRRLLESALLGTDFVPCSVDFGEGAENIESQADVLLADAEALDSPSIREFVRRNPQMPLVLMTPDLRVETLLDVMRLGGVEVVRAPSRREEILEALQRALKRRQELTQWAEQEANRQARHLRREVDELRSLLKVGHVITANLNLEEALKAVVDAARELTGAEESVLMLLDEEAGELYLRAESNLQSGNKTLRLKIEDSLAGEVVRTGKPRVIDKDTLEKIKTAYLVQALIYVPLYMQGRVIGVLGVDNRTRRGYFTERDVNRLRALADYAAVALENASLYGKVEEERRKLEQVIRQVKEGMAVVDHDGDLILVNSTAASILGLSLEDALNKVRFAQFCSDPDVLSAVQGSISENREHHTELQARDGRVFDVHIMPVEGIGVILTFYDITHFKKLDQLKSNFVNAVSHDLRSPLTAALGYIELLSRVGPLNPAQTEFLSRARASLDNITDIINNLLDLGKIEAGLDKHNEIVNVAVAIQYAVEGNLPQAEAKKQSIEVSIDKNLPPVLGNAVRLRQVVDNLLANAIKYTPEGGKIKVTAKAQGGQVIITVEDTGAGIPQAEQRYIFNKFYRASNVAGVHPGTGLGLSIVKSIVENHKGRIWVESEVGKGSKFTTVLPAAPQIDSEEETENPNDE